MIVKEEFLSKLRRFFSLNLYEVKIWTALLSRGVSTAGELSDIANDISRGGQSLEVINMEWLFKIKTNNLKANLNNLLNGKMAQRWREETEAILNNKISPELGLVLQDGGEIEDGFILSLPEESRDEIIKQVFLA